ncbi:MAG: endo-alpha-N-acetylgalactosaminidase family protein [Defluviitaleaceae bacterium]|nr:endo-alpha-N-acetylgalactosaminidase family protein [Defluviitaleaceae bacterium]MCL2835319.1 endo-alpha-N-acetylgalactosaminidase family protein [Defluviitaleaceae bacterium]
MLKLIDVYISAHLLSPRDCLFITGNWQNTAEGCPDQETFPFLDFEFGYQRIPENICKKKRLIGEYAPQINRLSKNETAPVTFLYKAPAADYWAGEFGLYLGFCDKDGVPVRFLGENETAVYRQYIGSIDISWGWGRAVVDLLQKPFTVSVNKAAPFDFASKNASSRDIVSIGDKIQVSLHKEMPAAVAYAYKDFKTEFDPVPPEIMLRDYGSDTRYYSYMKNVEVSYKLKTVTDGSAVYLCEVSVNAAVAAEFEISFTVRQNTAYINVDRYQEYGNFELIEIRYYSLACLSGNEARMADLAGGGREVAAHGNHPARYAKNYDVHNAAALYDSRGVVILEDFCLDNKIYSAVEGYGDNKYLSMGSGIAIKVCGAGNIKSITVPQSPIEVSVFAGEYGKPGWLSFCKYIRRNLKRSKYRDIHKQAIHYTVYSTQGPEPHEWQISEESPYEITRLSKGVKTKNILAEIKKLYNITDGYRQIPFLYGYHRQSDESKNLCFDVFTVDPRAGTLNELRRVIQDAPAYNTDISLYENYDDIYDTTTVDMKFAALDMYGKPWKGWIWADGESVAVGQRNYNESGEMRKRVKKMMETYGARRTGYIDVMSSEVLRWDFNPAYPSSAHTSCSYKHKIIEEYNKYGMDVYSESLVQPYVGIMGYAVSTRTEMGSIYYENERFFPMMNALYHGTIGYCSLNCTSRASFLKSLLTAGGYRFEYDDALPYEFIKWLYLMQMPLGLFEDEYLEDYIEENGAITLVYTNDCRITVNEGKMEYEIIAHGTTVAKDWTTFAPSPKGDGYLAYSLNGGAMKYKCATDLKIIRANVLTFEGEGEELENAEMKDGHLIINMPADKPVKIHADIIN